MRFKDKGKLLRGLMILEEWKDLLVEAWDNGLEVKIESKEDPLPDNDPNKTTSLILTIGPIRKET